MTSFPFSAIVGQDEMKQAMILTAIDASIGGVLVFGDRGTGKSTAVRALAALLPPIKAIKGCPVNSAAAKDVPDWAELVSKRAHQVPTPVVDLPLGATEDRVTGALDIEKALTKGEKAFQPGLLARANRGYLYIDEVNLLEDHIVDLLLDVAQSGENVVEREGLSIRHAARFVLVGSGNPEEGELRPQLLDRFGLSVEVASPKEITTRVEVIKRRDAYENDNAAFMLRWQAEDATIRNRILTARKALTKLKTPEKLLTDVAELCLALGSDGLRGELTLLKAARAYAAWRDDTALSATSWRHFLTARPAVCAPQFLMRRYLADRICQRHWLRAIWCMDRGCLRPPEHWSLQWQSAQRPHWPRGWSSRWTRTPNTP